MIPFTYYPIKVDTFISARETAKEESLDHPEHFIYLYKSNSGHYVIDHIGIKHDDERLLFTFKKGDLSL